MALEVAIDGVARWPTISVPARLHWSLPDASHRHLADAGCRRRRLRTVG